MSSTRAAADQAGFNPTPPLKPSSLGTGTKTTSDQAGFHQTGANQAEFNQTEFHQAGFNQTGSNQAEFNQTISSAIAPPAHPLDGLRDPSPYPQATAVGQPLPDPYPNPKVLTERIQTLEQALDQALLVIHDHQIHHKEQQQLEQQLATLENFSNLQQKAISVLQEQLTEARSQLAETMPSLDLGDSPEQRDPSEGDGETQRDGDIPRANYGRLKAQFQHRYRELEGERHQQQQRLNLLEQQLVELQEQVLRQAQQRREDETAIEHWRSRYVALRPLIQPLKDWANQPKPIPAATIAVLLQQLSPESANNE